MNDFINPLDEYLIPMFPPNTFRFRSPGRNTLDELENNYVFFQTRTKLNDELDSNPEFVELNDGIYEVNELRSTLNQYVPNSITKDYIAKLTDKDLMVFAKAKVKPYIENTGIACFTMYPMNYKLWAEYSKNDKGLCLHFDMNEDKHFFDGWRPITYVNELKKQVFNAITDDEHITELFFKKTKKWSYEKELRVLKDKIGQVKFKPIALKNILIGHKADNDFIDQVIDVVKRKYPQIKVYQRIKRDPELHLSYGLLYE
ncbi:hypothetical protein C7S20_04520 [Christiangramia fulva]|uniref:DUF2971 domain-containing protein n=1 Tax=Christiangramia fulva TaxID=2126553 RepID=A0A2R3Z2V9_9FLAO|nr:DUF2971 domain-containing protein [Christiangramia fulva]AVR44587.1 hypothetical protein C7S20_04520 [Christiangramia fulva]